MDDHDDNRRAGDDARRLPDWDVRRLLEPLLALALTGTGFCLTALAATQTLKLLTPILQP